jgi:hypothetical protein
MPFCCPCRAFQCGTPGELTVTISGAATQGGGDPCTDCTSLNDSFTLSLIECEPAAGGGWYAFYYIPVSGGYLCGLGAGIYLYVTWGAHADASSFLATGNVTLTPSAGERDLVLFATNDVTVNVIWSYSQSGQAAAFAAAQLAGLTLSGAAPEGTSCTSIGGTAVVAA